MTRRGKGEGSIFQRADGRWEARIPLPSIGGKRQRKSYFGATRAEVQKKARDGLKLVDENVPLPDDRVSVEAYFTEWLAGREAYMRPEAFRKYRSNVRNHVLPAIGRVALSKLTAAQVKAMYGACRKKGLAGTSLQHIHGIVHSALQDAVREERLLRNVADLVETPQRSTPEMQVLSKDDADSFITAARGDRLEALWLLAITSGLREGELLALRKKSVDLHRRRVTVTATLQGIVPRPKKGADVAPGDPAPGTPILGDPKTQKSKRTVVIPQFVAEALSEHYLRQLSERETAGDLWNDHGLVFTNAVGNPIDARNLRKRSFPNVLKRAGLAPIRFHDLRHTCATLLMAAGMPVKLVSEMLGHSDIAITLRVYSHVLPDMHEKAADTMDLLFGAEKAAST